MAGPLSPAWREDKAAMGKKIVARCRCAKPTLPKLLRIGVLFFLARMVWMALLWICPDSSLLSAFKLSGLNCLDVPVPS